MDRHDHTLWLLALLMVVLLLSAAIDALWPAAHAPQTASAPRMAAAAYLPHTGGYEETIR